MKAHRFFFFLTLLFLPSQLGLHFWPQWALVLGRRVDYLAPTLYFTDVLIVATILSWIISAIGDKQKAIRNIEFNRSNWSFFVSFGALFAVNVFVAANKPVALYTWIKFIEYIMLGFYIVKTKPNLSHITFCLSLAVMYSSVIAIVQFTFQHTLGGLLWFLGERTFSIYTPGIARMNICGLNLSSCHLFLRSYGTFPHPNVLGGFLVSILILIYTQLFPENLSQKLHGRLKKYYTVVFVLGIVALFLTMSRSAIVVGSVLLIILMMQRLFQERRKTISLFDVAKWWHIVIVMIFSIIVGVGVLNIRRFVADDESVVVRQQLNQAALTLFRQSPFFGVGLGNFLVTLPDVLPSRTIYFLQPVHNIYLLVLTETGVVGLLFFLWIIFMALRNFKFLPRRQAGQILNFKLSLISLLILGFVDHYPLTLQQGQLLFTILIAIQLLQDSTAAHNHS